MSEKTIYIPLRLEAETARLLDALCAEQNASRSSLIREFVRKGLKADGYMIDDDRIYKTTKLALTEILEPAISRLAAIGAKNAQMAGADYVMLIYLAKILMGAEGHSQIDEMSERARLAGIELLKAKDTRLAAILKKVTKETEDYI